MSHRKGSQPHNEGERWTPPQVQKLRSLANGNTPTGLIADALGRSKGAVQSKAAEKSITLKPTNQSPYNRLKKK